MVKVKKQIHIDAPLEKVFDFVIKPENLPEIWPSMIKTENIKPSPKGGHDFDWEYKMAGMPLRGHSKILEFVPNEHVVSENEGGIPAKLFWDYRAEDGGMRLDLQVEYEVPMPVLGKLAEKVVHKINENEHEVMLANLKVATEM
ncbi:MAG: hypothetical protein GWP61_14860 [Chloroflexi bacterium]|jgi:uncharacterized membrane protein|nr:hypothetical protein [Chloroflexota bacterium]